MKNTKILLINIIIFIFIFFMFDIFIYYRHLYMSYKYDPAVDKVSYIKHITRDLSENYVKEVMFNNANYPKAEKTQINESPYILFGCSFTEGAALKDEEKFTYQLASRVNAPVYNRAMGGWGTQHMIYQLKSKEFYDLIKPNEIKYNSFNKNEEYKPVFIYTYIPAHFERIHIAMEPILFGGYPTFVYKKNKNTLVFDKFSSFMFRFPLLSKIKTSCYFLQKTSDKIEFLKLHILEAKKEIDKHYKNAEFIVLVYDENAEILYIANSLLENNIKVVFFEGLTGINPNDESIIISKYDTHPNGKAWEILVPKLVEYLNNADENEVYKQAHFHQELLQDYNPDGNNYNIKMLMDRVLEKEISPASFSLCFQDRQLIKENKISKFRTSFAYISWCIGNMFVHTPLSAVDKLFAKIAIGLNPYNEAYKVYFRKYE